MKLKMGKKAQRILKKDLNLKKRLQKFLDDFVLKQKKNIIEIINKKVSMILKN